MIKVLQWAKDARKAGGLSVAAQLWEIARLRYGPYRLRAVEYYDYRLFEPGIPWQEKRRFIGSWIKDRVYRVQDPATAALCSDKLEAYRLFHAHGLPFPKLQAVTGLKDFPGAVLLNGQGRLAHWLRHEARYPLFAKPAVSYRGFGGMLLSKYDAASNSLLLGNGERIALTDFTARYGAPGAPAMLFQDLIRPHPAMAAVIGDRVATARLVVLNDGPEPELWRGGLRIPTGTNMFDNFRDGKSGNLLASIDLETGRIKEVYARFNIDQHTIDRHPDTGASFAGFVLPDWPQTVALIKAASKALPGLKIHGWDVAFTPTGPMLIETNPRGDFGIPQFMGQGGLAVPRFLKLYEANTI